MPVRLLEMSAAGAVLIVVITLIRALTLSRLPKRTFLALWAVALARLLIPFSLPSVCSVYTALQRGVQTAQRTTAAPVAAAGNLTGALPDADAAGAVSAAGAAGLSGWTLVWCAGALVCALGFALAYCACRREFRASLPVENAYIKEWLRAHSLRRQLSVRQLDKISAPLTYGLLRPVILLPKTTDWEDTQTLAFVLEHEYVHIRRFDALSKLLLTMAACAHWFNPLVWVMYALANRDIELSCDEAVVRRFGLSSRADYARALICMEQRRGGFAPLCSHFSQTAMEERISAIMKTRKITIVSLVLAAVLVAGTVTAFATSAKAEANDSDMLPKNQSLNEGSFQTATIDGILISYVDDEGQTRYLIDDGNTTKTLSEEEFEQQYPTSDVEWWTYEEYKDWLENEKVQLQSIVGEKAWTSGRGDFVWTQEVVDETIAEYETMLEEIKNGMMYSKTVDGDTEIMLGYDPSTVSTACGYQLFVTLENGDEQLFGPYETTDELLAAVKPFCEEQVKLGNMLQSEADEIIRQYTEN